MIKNIYKNVTITGIFLVFLRMISACFSVDSNTITSCSTTRIFEYFFVPSLLEEFEETKDSRNRILSLDPSIFIVIRSSIEINLRFEYRRNYLPRNLQIQFQ
jgi:hypothetical protein